MTTNNFSNLSYELINDKYSKAKYLGIECIMETKTGFINATKFCIKAQNPEDTEAQKDEDEKKAQEPHGKKSYETRGKRAQETRGKKAGDGKKSQETQVKKAGDGIKMFKHYIENARYNNLIKYMKSSGGYLAELSIRVTSGDYELWGTYVHPDLLLDLASWISPCVFCKVTQLLNEWRKLDVINELRFHKEVGDAIKEGIVFSKQENESIIRDQIAYEENGETEVKTPVGFIDVLTDTKIIEVKQANLWKHALGQVKCYGYYYPDKQKWIYLFNKRDTECEGKNLESDQDLLNICISENIMVKFYN